MLEALGGPGERSILSQKKRAGDGKEEKDETEEESREDSEAEEEHVKRDEDDSQREAERDENRTSTEEKNEMEGKKAKHIIESDLKWICFVKRWQEIVCPLISLRAL